MALETVTYVERDLAGATVATHAGVVALRRAEPSDQAGFGAGAQAAATRCRWHVKASSLPVRPLRGGRIVSAVDGTTWELERSANVETLGSRYSCETRKVAP